MIAQIHSCIFIVNIWKKLAMTISADITSGAIDVAEDQGNKVHKLVERFEEVGAGNRER